MKPSLFRKATAVLLSVTTLATQCVFGDVAQSSVWKDRRAPRALPSAVQMAALPVDLPGVPSRLDSSRSMPPLPAASALTPLGRALTALPANRTTISELRDTGSRAPVLILQDIHRNVEAQKNLEEAIRSLVDGGSVGSLHLEGGFGRLDLSRFRFFSVETRRRLVEDLLEQNAVGGPTAAAVLSNRAIETRGIDDATVYDDNVAAVRAAVTCRPSALRSLNELRCKIETEKTTIYGPALRGYDRLARAHRAGTLDFGGYVAGLAAIGLEKNAGVERFITAYRLETTLDLPRVERERRAVVDLLARTLSDRELSSFAAAASSFRDGRSGFAGFYAEFERLCHVHQISLAPFPAFRNYLRYVAAADRIDANRLLGWLDGAESRLTTRLARNDAERSLVALDRSTFLAERLVHFEMTPSEWAAWPDAARSLDDGLRGQFSNFEKFYRDADLRTDAMVAALLATRDPRPRVLVVGGFHAPGIVERLKRAGVPYALVCPRVSRTDAGTAYLDAFAREKTPLEKIFAGEKLSINPAGAVWGGRNADSRISGMNYLSRAAAIDGAAGRPLPDGVTATLASPRVIRTRVDGTAVDVAMGPADGFHPVDLAPIGGTRVVEPNSAYTPGAWATAWQGTVNLVARLTNEKLALKLRPLIAGTGEGAITASVALLFPGSIAAILAWQFLTMALHYVYGVYWWNPDLNTWDIVHYIRRAHDGEEPQTGEFRLGGYILQVPDRRYFRANMVAATSTVGFFVAALGAGATLTYVSAIVPHVIVSYTRERRIDEERRRAAEEKKRQFAEAGRIRQIVDNPAPPSPGERSLLLEELEMRNDLAAFMRFNDKGDGRYRLATVMQPGSTSVEEGPGFKTLNDTIGYNLMNVVFANRNFETWNVVQAVFGDLNARAGRPVVQLIGWNSKVVRFAIDEDAMEALFPDAATREAETAKRMNEATTRASEALRNLLTVVNRGTSGVANNEIVAAVALAQAKRKLPKKITTVPLYWGLSSEARRGNLDESLVRDAEATAAINAVRSEPVAGRPTGRAFTMESFRANLLTISSLKDDLTARGVLVPTSTPRGTETLAPVGLIDALRKKKDPAILRLLARQLKKDVKKDAAELKDTLGVLRRYVRLLSTFDSIKPWVGTRERKEAEEVAADVNASIAALEATHSPSVNPQEAWTALRPRLLRALSRDPRAPFLGSQFEFYGRSVPDQNDAEVAAIFVDFRGFGALIFNELESTASRLTDVALHGDDNALHSAFSAESLALGNAGLDPFAQSLRKVRQYFEERFGTDAGLRFYFGGDDVTVLLPRKLVYSEDPDRPSGELLRGIFQQVPAGMRVRVVAASSSPYVKRGDPTLAVALALQDADELAATAKVAEDNWKARRGKQVEEVVVYTDRSGAHYRAPVYDRRPGRGEMVFPGHDDNATAAVKYLMWAYGLFQQWRKGEWDQAAARQWAEGKAENSLILLAAFVATVELVMIPGLSILYNNFVGPGAAIILGAIVVVMFHELTVFVSWALRFVKRYIFRRKVPRREPPGPWTDWLFVRMAARFIAAAFILNVSFLPLYSAMAPGHMLLFETWRQFVPTLTSAWLMHVLWNIYVPPAWRLSLFSAWSGGEKQPQEEPAIAAYRAFNAEHGGTLNDVARLVDSLPIKLGVATLDDPSAVFAAASTAMRRQSDDWRRRGLMSSDDARDEWLRFSEKLRRMATGRDESGLTLQSEPALTAELRQEAADADAGEELVVLRFIEASTDHDGLAEARKAMAERGVARVVFVVKGESSAFEREFGTSATVVRWNEGLRMTDVQAEVARSVASHEGVQVDRVTERLSRASYRLLVPESFTLPADFMDGVSDLDRYKVFVLIRDALLAVEIQPTRLDEIGVIGRLIADQA